MVIVGEAVVRLRVISDKLASDIRKAVKDSLDGLSGDIDKEGEKAGDGYGSGMSKGIRKARAKISKEIELTARRFTADAAGVIDDEGDRLGRRFTTSFGDGFTDSSGWDEISRLSRLNFQRALGGNDSGLVKVGDSIGQNFARAVSSGMRELGPGIQEDVRRAFTMRPGDIDDNGRFAAESFTEGIDNGLKSRMGRLRQSVDDMANNMARQLGQNYRKFREYGSNASDRVGEGVRSRFGRMRAAMSALSASMTDKLRDALPDFDRAGEEAGERVSNGLRRSMSRNRTNIGKLFSDIGGDFGRHFNLGIGAAKMGAAIISLLALAAPSVLSGAAALGTAVGAQLVSKIAAAVPALVGALGVAAAAVSSLALSFGLLIAGFKSGNPLIADATARLKELGKEAAKPIGEGMAAGFSSFVDSASRVLPQITGLLRENGEAWGGVFERLGQVIERQDNVGRIQGILATNKTFTEQLGVSLAGLTSSFLILFNASKPYIDFIGDAIARFGEWAEATLLAKEANGELASFMQTTLDRFKGAAEAVGNLAVGLYNVGKAAEPFGRSMDNITQRFRDWTSSDAGQAKMTAFFEKAHILGSGLADMFDGIGRAAGNAFLAVDPGPILAVMDIIGNKIAPALAELWNQVQSGAGDNLVRIFDNIATALEKIAASGNFEKIADFIATLLEKVSEFAASDLGSTILSWVIPFALFGGVITSLIGPIISLGSAIAGLSAPVLAIGAVIAIAIGAFAAIYANSERFREAIGGLVEALSGTFMTIWEYIAPKVEKLWDAFTRLAGVIGDRLAPIIEALTPILQAVFTTIGEYIGDAIDVITAFFTFLADLFSGNWSGLWDSFVGIFSAAWNLIINLLGNVGGIIGSIFSGIGSLISGIWNSIWDFFEEPVGEAVDWVVAKWNELWAFAESIWGEITEFFSGIWDGVTDAITGAWDAISTFFSTTWEGIKIVAETIWNNIVSFFTGIWETVSGAFSAAWNGITSLLSDIWDGIIAGLIGFGNLILQVAMVPWRALVFLFDAIWQVIGDTLTGWWNWIVEQATTIWTGVTEFFGTIWNGISEAASTAWTAVSEFLIGIWNAIWGYAETIWNAIVAFFTGLWEGIVSAVVAAWTMITEFLTTVWNGIVAIATTVWTGVVTFLQGIWTAISEAVTTAWTAIWTFLTNIWNVISTAVSTAATAVMTFLAGIWEAISSTVSTVWNAISTFFSSIWQTISNTFHTVVDAVVQWLADRWQDISDTAGEIWGAISGIATTAWEAVVNAVESVVEPIVGWLQARWDDITSAVSTAFDSIAGPVREAWNAVYDSIVEPIVNAYTTLTGWVSEIVGLIQGAWDTVGGIISDINAAVATAADKVAEASTLGLGGQAGVVVGGSASGGIFRPTPGGQVTRVAEVGKAERVEPLDSKGLSDRDYAMIKRLGLTGGGEGGTPIVHVYIGQQELTHIVDTRVEYSNTNVARDALSGRRS